MAEIKIYEIMYELKPYKVTKGADGSLNFYPKIPNVNLNTYKYFWQEIKRLDALEAAKQPKLAARPTPKPKLAPQVVLQAGIGPSMEVVQAIKANPHLGKMLTIGFCGLIGFLATYRLNENDNLLVVVAGFALVFGVAVGLNYAFTKQPKPKPEPVKTVQIKPQTPTLPQAPQGGATPPLTPFVEEKKEKIKVQDLMEKCKDDQKLVRKLENLSAVTKKVAAELMAKEIKFSDVEIF